MLQETTDSVAATSTTPTTDNATYATILGSDPQLLRDRRDAIVVSLQLPELGEHEFRFVEAKAIGREYFHYAFRMHPKGPLVNVQVYGPPATIEALARNGKHARCELELVVKKIKGGREFILVNLYLTNPNRHDTHEFLICPAPVDRPEWVYTTPHMGGVGVSVMPL